MPLRCVIVDDSPSLLEAAAALLEREGVDVVGVASTSDEALALVEELKPDVTLVDIDLGGESGFDVVRLIDRVDDGRPPPRTILISTYAERDFLELIEASPAVGFLSKSDLSARTIQDLLGAAP